MAAEITIVIADDHPIFRLGLRDIVGMEPDLRIVGEAANGDEALDIIEQTRPRVAVIDVDMPSTDGLAVARAIHAGRLEVHAILLTLHDNPRVFEAAIDAGVRGYVLKDDAAREIVNAIRTVAAGRRYVTPAMSGYLLDRPRDTDSPVSALSPAERRVLRLVAEYKTSQEIADALFLSIRTVHRHRANIATRLALAGPHALLQFAIAHKDRL